MRVSYHGWQIELNYRGLGFLTPNPDWIMDTHAHPEYEFHLVTEGRGINQTETGLLELVPDSVYIAPPFESHKQWADRSAPIGLYYLLFSITGEHGAAHIPAVFTQLPSMKEELTLLMRQQFDETHRNRFLVELKLVEMIWKLVEPYLYPGIEPLNPTCRHYNYMKQAVDYVQQHLLEQPSVEQIADACHISSRHLNRLFMETMQRSVHNYIQTELFDLSCSRLNESSRSIAELSDELGFSSVNYFNRWFTAQRNVSPAKYRATKQLLLR